MSWIRHPIYMITTDAHIECFGEGSKGCCFAEHGIWHCPIKNLNEKARAKVVLNHLYKHYKKYEENGEFDKAELLSFHMEDIYMRYLTNRIFKWLHRRYWLKFMFKYDLD